MSALQELQEAVERVAERVGPAVVGVGRVGTGIVIADGAVVTNAHNLRREQVTVTLADGRRVDGSIAGVDADRDLAVVTAEGVGAGAEPIEWAADAPRLGTAVFGLANPGGGGLRVG